MRPAGTPVERGSRPPSSLRLLRVPGSHVHQPDDASGVIDAVPDPAGSRDLVLPLLHGRPIDDARGQTSLERVLAIVPLPRLLSDPLPCGARAPRRSGTEPIPSLNRRPVAVAEVPAVPSGWRGDPAVTLRHGLHGWRRHRVTGGLGGTSQTSRQSRISVDLGSGAPLLDELAQRTVSVQLSRGD